MSDTTSRLKRLREEKGRQRGTPLTQEEVARVVGCSPNYLSMLESGQRTDPGIQLLEALADYYNVSIDYLRCRTDDPAPPQQKDPQVIRFMPLPPLEYEELSPEEKEYVGRLTQDFIRTTIAFVKSQRKSQQ